MILGGKVKFSAYGAYCERFIDDLIGRKMKVSEISAENGIIYAEVGVHNYPAVAKLSRDYGVRVRLKERKGAYFRYRYIRKRPGLIIGTFLGIFLVLLLRCFVWHIEIHGNEELTDTYMLSLLEQNGFTAGVYANGTDALSAERNIMLGTDRIKWINIEVNGSRADVYMSEQGSKSSEDVDMKTPCNIVADRAGIIVESKVDSGMIMYEKGSGFAEGSVLVSGTVSSGDTVILVHSDAEITAEFYDETEFTMGLTTNEKVPTDEKFTRTQIMLLGMVVYDSSGDESTENTICDESVSDVTLFGFRLPVKIKTDTFTRYRDESVTRRREDVIRILNSRLEMYKYNFLKDYEILDTETNLEDNGDSITLMARIKLRGNVGIKKPIYER